MATKKLTKDQQEELHDTQRYMVINFGYSCSVCLPYADGAEIIRLLGSSDRVEFHNDNKDLTFKDGSELVDIFTISRKEFLDAKIRKLFGVTAKEQASE